MTIAMESPANSRIGQMTTEADVVAEDGGRVWIRLAGSAGGDLVSARPAMAGGDDLPRNSRVLVCGTDRDWYVIGVLWQPARQAASDRLTMSNGAVAEVEDVNGCERLTLRAGNGEVILEYDDTTGTTRLNTRAGRLDVLAEGGDIGLRAAGELRLEGETVSLHGRRQFQAGIADSQGRMCSGMQVTPERLGLTTTLLSVCAARGEIALNRVRYVGDNVLGKVGELRLYARSLTTVAESLVERTGTAYRCTRDLLETRAGRLRTVVAGGYNLMVRRASLKATRAFRIDGERIDLG